MVKNSRVMKRGLAGGIGTRLKKARLEANLSSVQMTARLEISVSACNKNESRLNLPGIGSFYVLNQEFNISLDWLFFNKGPECWVSLEPSINKGFLPSPRA